MDFLERRNLGVPSTIFVVLAYMIGYSVTNNIHNLIIGVTFAILIFAFDFDDKVKIAVKQSYFFAFVFAVIYLMLNIMPQIESISTISILSKLPSMTRLHQVIMVGVNILAILVYIIFIVAALFDLDIRIKSIIILFTDTKEEAAKYTQQKKSAMSHENEPQKKDNKRTKKLFPPSQQQYPHMPKVEKPAKSDQNNENVKAILAELYGSQDSPTNDSKQPEEEQESDVDHNNEE